MCIRSGSGSDGRTSSEHYDLLLPSSTDNFTTTQLRKACRPPPVTVTIPDMFRNHKKQKLAEGTPIEKMVASNNECLRSVSSQLAVSNVNKSFMVCAVFVRIRLESLRVEDVMLSDIAMALICELRDTKESIFSAHKTRELKTHLSHQKCAKTHLRQSGISKIFRE